MASHPSTLSFHLPPLLLPLHHFSLEPRRSSLRPLPLRMLLALQFLFDTFSPVLLMFQKLHPRGSAVLMLVTHVKAPDRRTRRMMDELYRRRALVATLTAVAGSEDEVLGHIFDPQIDRGGAGGEIRWETVGKGHRH